MSPRLPPFAPAGGTGRALIEKRYLPAHCRDKATVARSSKKWQLGCPPSQIALGWRARPRSSIYLKHVKNARSHLPSQLVSIPRGAQCLFIIVPDEAYLALISYSTKDNAKLKTYRWLLDTPPNYGDKCSKWTGRPSHDGMRNLWQVAEGMVGQLHYSDQNSRN